MHRVVDCRAAHPFPAGGFTHGRTEVENGNLKLHQPLRPGDHLRRRIVFFASKYPNEPVYRAGRAAGTEHEIRGHDNHDSIAAVVNGSVPGMERGDAEIDQCRRCPAPKADNQRKRGEEIGDKEHRQPAVRAGQQEQAELMNECADPAVIRRRFRPGQNAFVGEPGVALREQQRPVGKGNAPVDEPEQAERDGGSLAEEERIPFVS